MGFFSEAELAFGGKRKDNTPSLDLLHQQGCRLCSLNHVPHAYPKMLATGSKTPDIYCLGEAPGKIEKTQFVGDSGNYLRDKLGKEWIARARFNNVINCFPNRTPEFVEIEACRPRIESDIEQTKPTAVFGFGAVPLQWAIGESVIANWRGRRIPIRVGTHACWYYAFHHPAHLLRQRTEANNNFVEDERFFALDLKRALAEVEEGLPPPEPHTKEMALAGIEIIEHCTHEDALLIVAFLEWAVTQPTAGVDIETPPVRPYAAHACILTVAVAASGSTLSFPIDHPEAKWSADDKATVIQALQDFLRAPTVRKPVHNLAYEMEYFGVLYGREYIRASLWDDTMSQAFVLDQRVGRDMGDDENGIMECFGLGFLTRLHFGLNIKPLSNVDREKIAELPLYMVLPYNGMDAKYHELLYHAQSACLEREGLMHVYLDHLRRIPTCTLTQIKGVPLDNAEAERLGKQYDAQIKELRSKVDATATAKAFFRRTGKPLNPASNADMVVVCRDILQSDVGKRRDGKYTVNEEALARIDDPLMPYVLTFRGAAKMRSTYVFDRANPVVWPDGLLHPMLNTVRARTARLSSADPNGQNIPVRTEEGKKIRNQVAAAPGHCYLSLDYGQIQPRIFAMVSKDKRVTRSFWEDYDIHMEWARRIALRCPSRADPNDKAEMKAFRQDVKSGWVLALFFGALCSTAARHIKVDEVILKPLYDEFWREFSGIKDWQVANNTFYEENGYVEFLTGRRRCGPLGFNVRINSPIQIGEAEITLDGANRISEMDIWETQPVLMIHDDNILHVPEEMVDDVLAVLISEMVKPDVFDFINVPIVVEVKRGKTWGDMKVVGTYSSVEFYGKDRHLGLREGEL